MASPQAPSRRQASVLYSSRLRRRQGLARAEELQADWLRQEKTDIEWKILAFSWCLPIVPEPGELC